MAALGDLYVNDAFSAAHRAHASTEGLARAPAGLCRAAMEAELGAEKALGSPERPVAAVVGGAKVSTKLDVLTHLVAKVDHLIIGGGMANTFPGRARAYPVGKSLCEHDLAATALGILERRSGRTARASALRRGGRPRIRAATREPSHLQRPRGWTRRDDPRRRPGGDRGAGRCFEDLPDAGLERADGCVRNAALRHGHRGAGAYGGGVDAGRKPGVRAGGGDTVAALKAAGVHWISLSFQLRAARSRMDGKASPSGVAALNQQEDS
jgi:hypothetical protein